MVKSGEKSISMNKRELGTWGWWPHQMLRSPQLIGADIDPTGFLSPCVEYVLMLPTSNWEYGAYGAVAELLSIMWLQPWSVAGLGQFKNGVDVVPHIPSACSPPCPSSLLPSSNSTPVFLLWSWQLGQVEAGQDIAQELLVDDSPKLSAWDA